MTQTDNRLLDDLTKLLTGAVGAAQGVREEMQTLFRQQAERLVHELDLVPREEFDAVKTMAVEARMENERLAARLAALEEKLSAQEPQKKGAGTKRAPKSKG